MKKQNVLYDKILQHWGHKVEIANYAEGANVAVECLDCNEVIVDVNK